MSNPIQITEQMTVLNSSGSAGSRDSSLERKSKAGNKAISGLRRRSSSKDSPDRATARDTPQETKDRNSKENKSRRSVSAEGTSKAEPVENGLKAETETTKRSRRPKSLDLTSKSLTNGDDDNFRSPHPLTPCNVAVKRRKGRPKETPPTLVAESPVDPVNDSAVNEGSVVPDTEMGKPEEQETIEPVNKRKCRSKTNTEKVTKTKNLSKPFVKKKFESGVKTLGSKIMKKRLFKGFKKLPPLQKETKARQSVETGDSDSECSPKRKPGRPPGAKNKSKSMPETVSPSSSPEKKRGGRPPGARRRAKIGVRPKKRGQLEKRRERLEQKKILESQMQESLKLTAKTDTNESLLTSKTESDTGASDKDTELQTDISEPVASNGEAMEVCDSADKSSRTSKSNDSVDSEIPSTAGKSEPDMTVKKPDVLRTADFKDKKGVKSLGKLKKENINKQRVTKKRVLISHAENLGRASSLDHLPSNDLRRKLQKKLIEKLNGKRPKTGISNICAEVKEVNETDVMSDTINQNTEAGVVENEKESPVDNNVDTEAGEMIGESASEPFADKDIHEDIQSLSALVEQKRVAKTEPETTAVEQKRKGRPRKSNSEQRELSKFSDSESVCSELSTQSLGSLRRSREKQILILGEENTDSDDNTVRTRQRFEIIPGKKRKRTLSGEFDLVDERQLRKQRKQEDHTEEVSADESDSVPEEERKPPVKKKSPVKISPKMKLKKELLAKKHNRGSHYAVFKAKQLKQSPFLDRTRKRRKQWFRKNRFLSSSDSELGAYGLNRIEIRNSELEDIKKKNEAGKVLVKTEIIETEQLTEVISNTELEQCKSTEIMDDNFSELDCKGIEQTNNDLSDVVDNKLLELTEIDKKDEAVKVDSGVTKVSEMCSGDTKVLETESQKNEVCSPDRKELKCKESEKVETGEEETAKVEAETQVVEKVECDKIEEVKESDEKEESKNETFDSENFAKEIINEIVESITMEKGENDLISSESLSKDKEDSLSVPYDENVAVQLPDSKKTDSNENQTEIPENETAAIIHSTELALNESRAEGSEGLIKTPTSGRGGKGRRGRRPYKHLLVSRGGASPNAGGEKKVREKKVNKESPEFAGVTRKFELRQKISRSPLDNIALKQSLEENEYYKNEAQKAVRKEMKKAKKSPLSVENTVISPQTVAPVETVVPVETVAQVETVSPSVEPVVDPVIEKSPGLPEVTEEEESASEETENQTELLLAECKPCSVVLIDFIKQLERSGRKVTSEDETENDTEGSVSDMDHTTDMTPQQSPMETDNINQDSVEESDLKSSKASYELANVSTEMNQADSVTNTVLVQQRIEESSPKDNVSHLRSDKAKSKSPEKTGHKSKVSESQSKAATLETRTPIKTKINASVVNASDAAPILKSAAQVKSKRTSRKSIQSGRGRKVEVPTIVLAEKEKPEPQTARKTVPPLKIKLKETPRSRRKTYMVETIMDDQANFTVVKKKSGSKSGNKSDSDKEKSSKGHHHKRRNKIPVSQVPLEPKIKEYTPLPPKPAPQPHTQPVKKPIEPTDAFEANFLQFIKQNESSQEQKMMPMYSNIKTRGKPTHQLFEGKAYKVDSDGSFTVTASSIAETTTSSNTDKLVLSANTDKLDKSDEKAKPLKTTKAKDSKEIQYVCSYCDKTVFREKEYIIKHIKEVHTGEPVMYKELPYVISENHIEYLKDTDKQTGNVCLGGLYTSEDSKVEKKVPDKTSAEADSTTVEDLQQQLQQQQQRQGLEQAEKNLERYFNPLPNSSFHNSQPTMHR